MIMWYVLATCTLLGVLLWALGQDRRVDAQGGLDDLYHGMVVMFGLAALAIGFVASVANLVVLGRRRLARSEQSTWTAIRTGTLIAVPVVAVIVGGVALLVLLSLIPHAGH
jgi:hypothetical protein